MSHITCGLLSGLNNKVKIKSTPRLYRGIDLYIATVPMHIVGQGT